MALKQSVQLKGKQFVESDGKIKDNKANKLQSWTLNQYTFYDSRGILYHKQNRKKLLYI